MTTTKSKLEFVFAMARHTSATVRQCEALMRYAGTLQRLAEDDCNVPTDDIGLQKREMKGRQIRHKTAMLCAEIADIKTPSVCIPVFSGDPRGAVLKVRVPSGWSNDFGGEGIAVPS